MVSASQYQRWRPWLLVLVAVAVVGLWWWSQQPGSETTERTTSQASPSATASPTSTGTRIPAPPAGSATGGDNIRADQLPQEARDTIALIRRGGPFPYDRDGVVFGNRERLLPQRQRGYYREYTVPTPGSQDRGARRIVTGGEGEMYYTADHYDSFQRVELVR